MQAQLTPHLDVALARPRDDIAVFRVAAAKRRARVPQQKLLQPSPRQHLGVTVHERASGGARVPPERFRADAERQDAQGIARVVA